MSLGIAIIMPHALCSAALTSPLDERFQGALDRLEQDGLRRAAPRIRDRDGARYVLDDRPVVGFCSNDYLGYAAEAAGHHNIDAAQAGAGASRLISGDLPIHRAVEQSLAAHTGYDDAILFASGYACNVGVLPALLHEGDHVYSDRLNHASLIDGLRLAAPRPHILDPLTAPAHHAAPQPDHVAWWICESLYSMDGVRPDLDALQTWQHQGHVLYVDAAHDYGLSTGGRSSIHDAGIHPDVFVGTLGKAYGAAGAFVAAGQATCDYLLNRARSFVFTTGVSPLLAQQIAAQLPRVQGPDGDARRARLSSNLATLSDALKLPVDTPILPLHVGEPRRAVELSRALLERGWHVQAIRPPTVPPGTSRLRLTLSAAHTQAQVEDLAADLKTVFNAANLALVRPPLP